MVAHTLSPVDLIPDFIPVLGYLDDLIITPLGIWLALKMIPPQVMMEARAQARQGIGPNARWGRLGAGAVLLIWVLIAAGIVLLADRLIQD